MHNFNHVIGAPEVMYIMFVVVDVAAGAELMSEIDFPLLESWFQPLS